MPARPRFRRLWTAIAAALCTVAVSTSTLAVELGPEVRAAIKGGDYAEAATLLKKETSPELRLEWVKIQLIRGEYAEAASAAKQLAKSEKTSAVGLEAAARHAEALAAQGKVDDAIAVLRDVEEEAEARRARLLLGELLIRKGQRGDARRPLMTLIEDYNADAITAQDAEGLSMVGRAAHLLRSARDANDAYNEAEKAGAKTLVETLLWRAELFLEKYDPGHAGQVVQEAVALAPKDPRVRVMLAHVKLDSAMDFGGAQEELEKALEVNPRLTDAYFVKAGLALRDMDIEAADKAIKKGLETDPTDLDLLSMRAAARFLADDERGFEKAKKGVFDLNPTYTPFFHIVGEYAEWEHRYEEIVKMMEEGTTIDSQDPKLFAQLGLNLIRAGREKEGVAALERAWDKDRFNVRVFNTLNLFEKNIATDYVTVDGTTFKIRYHRAEKKILERYVPRMLEEAWGSMVKRYRFTPKKPVQIELYADSEHFSVRTSGLPNVGIQGVCFGQTLAMLSPSAAPFNWGNVLWHELGHVFAIQLSESHVPRWFTEGLSEYETIVRRTEWKREEDIALYQALERGDIPEVAQFNRAFTHVDSIEQVTMAYYAASQLVVFMVEEFGFDKVVSMMPRWANGDRTPEVVQASLGISTQELDRRFRAWLKPRLERYEKQYVPELKPLSLEKAEEAAKKKPDDAKAQLDLALALLQAGDMEKGKTALERARKLDPKNADAMYLQLRLALAEDRADDARKLIRKLFDNGVDGYALRLKAADLADSDDDYKKARAHFEKASALDPTQAEPLQGLVDLAHRLHDGAGELEALRRLALIDQHDRRVWHRLLDGLVARGMWKEAVEVGESAVFVDIRNPDVHRLYARALARSGRHNSAVFEYNSAIIAGAPPPMLLEIYAELDKAYTKMGKKEYAQRAKKYGELVKKATPGAGSHTSPSD